MTPAARARRDPGSDGSSGRSVRTASASRASISSGSNSGGVVQSGRGRQGKPDAAGGGQLKALLRRRRLQNVPAKAVPTGSADRRALAVRHAGRSRGGVTAPGSRAPGRRPTGAGSAAKWLSARWTRSPARAPSATRPCTDADAKPASTGASSAHGSRTPLGGAREVGRHRRAVGSLRARRAHNRARCRAVRHAQDLNDRQQQNALCTPAGRVCLRHVVSFVRAVFSRRRDGSGAGAVPLDAGSGPSSERDPALGALGKSDDIDALSVHSERVELTTELIPQVRPRGRRGAAPPGPPKFGRAAAGGEAPGPQEVRRRRFKS